MPKSTPPALSLGSKTETKHQGPLSPGGKQPTTPHSPRSPPSSPGQSHSALVAVGQRNFQQVPAEQNDDANELPTSPVTAIPAYPPSPTTSAPQLSREASRSFFSHLKASRSSNRLNGGEVTPRASSKPDLSSRASSKDRNVYNSSRGRGSTPDLQNYTSPERGHADHNQAGEHLDSRPVTKGESHGLSESDGSYSTSSRKSKGKFGLLSRTRSMKLEDGSKAGRPGTRQKHTGGSDSEDLPSGAPSHDFSEPMKTAPLQPDREKGFWSSVNRNRSADRQLPQSQDDNLLKGKKDGSIPAHSGSQWSMSAAFKQAGSKAADGLGKTRKGLLNKMVRSGSGSEKEKEHATESPYVLKVINLPLIEQTRTTRISKKLELSRDKTEYWMPALPWRCIDYLNANGCEEEGLYRIPGSGKDIKVWQKRFDQEHDVNLLDQTDLYDINTIGSLLKGWLRDLPDEIFPKEIQARIQKECGPQTETPQMLRDELSNLPPYNYYLLFAITCHLSLLLSYKDINKMDYRNLCICFQPCMKIDHYCFMFLVCDWKNCWQGCRTEKTWLAKERGLEQADEEKHHATERRPATGISGRGTPDERAISSSESSNAHGIESQTLPQSRAAPSDTFGGGTDGLDDTDDANETNVDRELKPPNGNHTGSDPQRLSLGLRPLSPIRVE